jgi:hypothetical protein
MLAAGSLNLPKTNYGTGFGPGHLPATGDKPMPIFHFDIADGVRLEDPVGLDCADESDARKTADLIARQIAIDLADGVHDRSVVVVNEDGSEIYTTPVKA